MDVTSANAKVTLTNYCRLIPPIGGVEVGERSSTEVRRTLVENRPGCGRQIMAITEVCLHGDKLEQDAISLYLHNGPIVSHYFLFARWLHDLDIRFTCSDNASLCVTSSQVQYK